MTNEIIPTSPPSQALTPALAAAIEAWAESTTDPTSSRRHDLKRDKARAVGSFVTFTNKPINQITALDISIWRDELEKEGKAPATIYALISRLSSFYEWMKATPEIGVHFNPVDLARPKAPKAYQTESTKSLDDQEVRALVRTVKAKADAGELVGKRDYAMLIFFLLTGLRRAEVCGLRWGDVKINGAMVVTVKVKGGELVNKEVKDPAVKVALFDYLETSGRLESMTPDSPLWIPHDPAQTTPAGACRRNPGKPKIERQPGARLTSHAFADNLKRYAKAAGIGPIHLHQTRHTYARIVAEESGSMTETQDALGHKNLATTRVYVQRVGLKKDKFSGVVGQRLGIE